MNSQEALLAYLQGFITPERKAGFETILKQRTKHITVVTEDVYQLHNTSAVMRSCEVFGVQEMHVVEQRLGKKIDKEIALGAEKWVDIYRHNHIQTCIDTLKEKGYKIIATTPHNQDCDLQDFEINQPIALFFGTERHGLSEAVIQQADGFLKIPMVGFTESLNISVSAAIILQHLTHKLRNSSIHWQLNEAELLDKKIDWTRKSIKDIDYIEKLFLEKTSLK